jgi:hypothetical protein
MKHGGSPYAQLAEAAGKVRMRSLVQETRYAQAKADRIELSGFLERVAWMQARSLVMQARNPKAIEMIRALSALERAIEAAIMEARTS